MSHFVEQIVRIVRNWTSYIYETEKYGYRVQKM